MQCGVLLKWAHAHAMVYIRKVEQFRTLDLDLWGAVELRHCCQCPMGGVMSDYCTSYATLAGSDLKVKPTRYRAIPKVVHTRHSYRGACASSRHSLRHALICTNRS